MDTRALKPDALHILAALAEGDAHGYAVMQRVHERTNGRVRLRTGSFYRHLSRLIESGCVQPVAKRPPDHDPRRGTYYRLTARGQEVLVAERRYLSQLAAALRPRKGHV